MLYYIWMLHYSLIKRIYRERRKKLKKVAGNIAFSCFFLLLLFILVLLSNKALLGNIIWSGVTLAPIGGAIVAILLIPLLFFYRGLTSKKIGILRKVVSLTRNVKHIYSLLYISFFVVLYLSTIIIMIATVPHHTH